MEECNLPPRMELGVSCENSMCVGKPVEVLSLEEPHVCPLFLLVEPGGPRFGGLLGVGRKAGRRGQPVGAHSTPGNEVEEGSPGPCGVAVWLGCSPSTGCPCSHFPALMVTPLSPAAPAKQLLS